MQILKSILAAFFWYAGTPTQVTYAGPISSWVVLPLTSSANDCCVSRLLPLHCHSAAHIKSQAYLIGRAKALLGDGYLPGPSAGRRHPGRATVHSSYAAEHPCGNVLPPALPVCTTLETRRKSFYALPQVNAQTSISCWLRVA